MLIDVKVSFYYLRKIDNNVVSDLLERVKLLLKDIHLFIIIAHFNFIDIDFNKEALLNNKSLRLNYETLNFFKTLQFR